MRILVFFDLPTLTAADRRAYRVFVKELKKEGFIMLQESVYSKIALNNIISCSCKYKVKKMAPNKGIVSLLVITERQFNSIEMFAGSFSDEIISDERRLIEL